MDNVLNSIYYIVIGIAIGVYYNHFYIREKLSEIQRLLNVLSETPNQITTEKVELCC